MQKAILSMLVVAATVVFSIGRANSQRLDNVEMFMRAKLVHSQKVLEGLATEDYDVIAKHSQEMSLLSQASTWQVLQTAEYRQHSLEFRRACDGITAAAKKKNLDAAALAYVETTLKCINCHKYVRRAKTASLDEPGVVAPIFQQRYEAAP